MMKSILFIHASWCKRCKFVEKEKIIPLMKLYGNKVSSIDVSIYPSVAEKLDVSKIPAIFLCDPSNHKYKRVDDLSLEQLKEALKDD